VGQEAAKSLQLCDRRVKPGGAVTAERGLPAIEERFTVLYRTRPPLRVQRVLFGALAAIASALVHRDSYPKYSGGPAFQSGGGTGPPSTMRVVAGAIAVAAPLFLAALFLVGWTRHPSKGGPRLLSPLFRLVCCLRGQPWFHLGHWRVPPPSGPAVHSLARWTCEG
jgi:hypothetical protein